MSYDSPLVYVSEKKPRARKSAERSASGKAVSAGPEKEAEKTADWIMWLNIHFSTIRLKDKMLFAKNLSVMLGAGLTLSRGLSILERQTKNMKFKQTISDLYGRVVRGESFHESLAAFPDVFPSLFVAMAHAGEESGKLSDSLASISVQLERAYTLRRKTRGAMIYPAIIVAAMIIIGILMLVYVVPTLTATFEELAVDLPASTQFIITTSGFLRTHTFLFLFLFFGFIAGFYTFGRTRFGKHMFDWAFLHMPLIGGLTRKINAARTARTLSSLLISGVGISDALDITKEVLQNSYYKVVVQDAKENIQKGLPISEAFLKREDIYPLLVSEMMTVGEETGKLSTTLAQMADFYESEVETATNDLSTIIEPFLLIVIGIGVGFFAISMIQPMYSLSSGF